MFWDLEESMINTPPDSCSAQKIQAWESALKHWLIGKKIMPSNVDVNMEASYILTDMT